MLHVLLFPTLFKGQNPNSIHSFTAHTLEGKTVRFSDFAGKKILIVNTASKCGLTPQYKQLQELHAQYKDKGLVIIGFPCNDFAQQEPGGKEEIQSFCERNYGVEFLMMEKVHVKGKDMHPLYRWLTSRALNGVMNSKVKWNFQKYLIDEKGYLVDAVSPARKPNCRKILRWINGD